ncbi:hypothetical protein SDC9_205150 [bioreactor metagenome]|uniref:Uncharacterized protein n=1 Tax=bioreactor metagenome TaxID=1076179 RepID=A0A645J1X8_9ZZZZ
MGLIGCCGYGLGAFQLIKKGLVVTLRRCDPCNVKLMAEGIDQPFGVILIHLKIGVSHDGVSII